MLRVGFNAYIVGYDLEAKCLRETYFYRQTILNVFNFDFSHIRFLNADFSECQIRRLYFDERISACNFERAVYLLLPKLSDQSLMKLVICHFQNLNLSRQALICFFKTLLSSRKISDFSVNLMTYVV